MHLSDAIASSDIGTARHGGQPIQGRSMEELAKFLRAQSASLRETAKRCTDPRIAAELVSVAEMLHAKAEELRPAH